MGVLGQLWVTWLEFWYAFFINILRNENRTSPPGEVFHWETLYLNWMHKSVNYLQIHNPLMPHSHRLTFLASWEADTLQGCAEMDMRFSRNREGTAEKGSLFTNKGAFQGCEREGTTDNTAFAKLTSSIAVSVNCGDSQIMPLCPQNAS